jgi:hypothetical protein
MKRILSILIESQASGSASLFVEGAKADRIFMKTEYPTLKSNLKMDRLNYYDKYEVLIKWENLK